jgi:hypothetical protein
LVIEMSSVSRHGLGLVQSIPVEGLRWTFSTSTDHNAIGMPAAATLTSAEYGPSIPNQRATPTQTSIPASPTSPVAVDTAEAGRGSALAAALPNAGS